MTNKLAFVSMILAAIMLSACNSSLLPALEEAPDAAEAAHAMQTAIILSTASVQAPVATTEIAPSPTPLPVAEKSAEPEHKIISANGISFSLPTSIASDALGMIVMPQPSSADMPEWDNLPETYTFKFQDYLLNGARISPDLSAWSVDALKDALPEFSNIVDDFRKKLDANLLESFKLDNIPYMPPINAGKLITVKTDVIDFKNGRGLRYITSFSQSIAPVTNEDLFYTFQGLSNDGKYYVSLTLPVSQHDLPANQSSVQVDEKWSENFTSYLDTTSQMLEDSPLDAFMPSISILDNMVSTIELAPKRTEDSLVVRELYLGPVMITINDKLASGANLQYQERNAGDGSGLPMSAHPAMIQATLEGYPINEHFHEPKIIVFDPEEYSRWFQMLKSASMVSTPFSQIQIS